MTDTTPEPEVFDFDAWLEQGTTSTVDVTINNNFDRRLQERYDQLDAAATAIEKKIAGKTAAIAAAEAAAADDDADEVDESLEAVDEVVALNAELDAICDDLTALYERYHANDITVTVRALDPVEIEEISAEHFLPGAPARVGKNPTREERRQWDRDIAHWRKEITAAELARDIAQVERAIVKVVTATGATAPALNAERLRRMHQQPHGPLMFKKIHNAVKLATTGDMGIDAPKLRAPSTSDPA